MEKQKFMIITSFYFILFFITFYFAFSTNRLFLDIEKKENKIRYLFYNKIKYIHICQTFPPIPSHMFIPSKSRTQ